MSFKLMKGLQQRVNELQNEIKGVVSQTDVTQWEAQFLCDLQGKNVSVGSQKQRAIVERIEKKVFGEDYSYEQTTKE